MNMTSPDKTKGKDKRVVLWKYGSYNNLSIEEQWKFIVFLPNDDSASEK